MYIQSVNKRLDHAELALFDVLCLNLAGLFVYLLCKDRISGFMLSRLLCILGVDCLCDLVYVFLFSEFSTIKKRGYYREFVALLKQSLVIFFLTVLFIYIVYPDERIPMYYLALGICLFLVLAYICRTGWKHAARFGVKNSPDQSLVLITASDNISDKVELLAANLGERFLITGLVVSDKDMSAMSFSGIPVVCSISDAPLYVCRNWVDDVFVDETAIENVSADVLQKLTETGVIMHTAITKMGNALSQRQFFEDLCGYPVLTSCMNESSRIEAIVKRTVDIIAALVGCLITGVIYLFIAPIIKQQSPGPVFFKQRRIGKNGKVFVMYKFRSMYMDAEERKNEFLSANRVSNGMMFKLDFDPRIIGNTILPDGTHKTGIGDFIRRTSLDEFPQFINVLKGDMSLVGTRPPTLDEWDRYELHHRARLAIKPGITGMWQVSGRSSITDFEEVVTLDKKYINNWSLGLDMRIILRTVSVMLRKEGAM